MAGRTQTRALIAAAAWLSGACSGDPAPPAPLPAAAETPSAVDAPAPAGDEPSPVPLLLGVPTPKGTTTTRDRDGDGCSLQSCQQSLVTPGGTAETIQAALYASLLDAGFSKVADEPNGSLWSRCGTAVRFGFGAGDQWGYEWWPKAHINETADQAMARMACERERTAE